MREIYHKPINQYYYKHIQEGNKFPISSIINLPIEEQVSKVIQHFHFERLQRMLMYASQVSDRRIPSQESIINTIKNGLEEIKRINRNNCDIILEYITFSLVDGNLVLKINCNI